MYASAEGRLRDFALGDSLDLMRNLKFEPPIEVLSAADKADLGQARAVVSTSEAIITGLKLEIALLRRNKYGWSAERTAQLLTSDLERFVAEYQTILRAGLAPAPCISVDDTGARAAAGSACSARAARRHG